ncbi:MAG: hypothetical protein ACR2KQ_08665 [Actinomycetota bacterium]
MLDDSYRAMLRHFGTFFLVPAVVIAPLHLAYAFAFREVIALGELHSAIEALPRGADVRGITGSDIATARLVFWGLVAVEILLVPIFAAVTRRAMKAEEGERIGRILGYWQGLRDEKGGGHPPTGVLVPAVLITGMIAILASQVVAPLVQVVPSSLAWAVAGLGATTAHCLAAPFLLVPWAWTTGTGADSAPSQLGRAPAGES